MMSAGSLFVVFAAGLLASAAGADTDRSYGAVIDAGSSGSRVYIYSWPKREFEGDEFLPPQNLSVPVAETTSFKCTPGVDSPAGVAELTRIVEEARKFLVSEASASEPARTAIFLKATAGLRVLPPKQRSEQLQSVRQMLRASGFLFRSESQARVISGEEEGVFGWITVNYMLGRLNYTLPGTLQGSYGALDLGGASTQITFKPSDPDILENSYSVRLGGVITESVYTHSFLYFGANEAIARADAASVFASWPGYPSLPAPASVSSPCRFTGSTANYTDPATGATTTISGSGSLASCRGDVVASLLNKAALCLTVPKPSRAPALRAAASPGPRRAAALGAVPSPAPAINASAAGCSFQGVYQPPAAGLRLVAFSGFTFAWATLGMPEQGGTLEEFRSRADAFCALSWEDAQRRYPAVPARFLAGYCFSAAYTLGLLVDGYGLDPRDPSALRVAPSADTYGWALGSILYEANSLPFSVLFPPTRKPQAAEPVPLYVVSALLAAAILIALALAARLYRTSSAVRKPLIASRADSVDSRDRGETINPISP